MFNERKRIKRIITKSKKLIMGAAYDPTVWGPHYWFFIMSLATNYPIKANDVTKKKYYDFFSNLPLFIPHDEIGNQFSALLDKYPVSPYLDGKDSFLKWVNYIHNKINEKLGKDKVTLVEGLEAFYENYKPKEIKLREEIKYRKNLVVGGVIVMLLVACYYMQNK